MAGKVVVSTLNNDTGVLATQNGMTGIAKAWVNFNGTGTVAIRDSFNVSSITDNGTGDYTVNLTTAMPNTNYVVTTMGNANYGVDRSCHPSIFTNISAATESAPTTTSFKVGFCNAAGNAGEDLKYICVAVFSS